jgi:glycosyl-4,4'-diaponeurosporenoate acyltransferase
VSPFAAVAVDAAVWASWGTAVGYAAARMPDDRFVRDNAVTVIRPWERGGRTWERLRVRRWKGRLPELGELFGGRSKRHLSGRDRQSQAQLAIETRRAEMVHWLALLPLAVMPLWNPAWLTAVMAGYAITANGPCVIVQRYNRARIGRLVGLPARPRRTS